MNVTKDGFKDRQLHIEDYLQMVSAEQKEYAEVSAHQRIAENNDIITDFQTDNLMEQILHKDNLNKAYKKVKTKFKELKKLGVEEEKVWICANMRNGNWYCSGYFVLQTAFNNKKLRELGYPTFTEFYLKICEN